MSKILVIGDIYFEQQFFVEKIPNAKEFSFSNELKSYTGSKTINAGRVITKQGGDVSFYGKVGNDAFGLKCVQQMSLNYGFDTQYITELEDGSTGQIVTQTNEQGDSSFTLFTGINKSFNDIDLKNLSSIISKFEGIYCATNLELDFLYGLIELANEKKIPLFLDVPNQHTKLDLSKISKATFISPNRQEAELLLKTQINDLDSAAKAIKKLFERLQSNVIITLDSEGAMWLGPNMDEPLHFKTEIMKVVDAAASGDIFRGIFFHQWLNNRNVSKSIEIAMSIASKATQIRGVDQTLNSLDFFST